MRRYLRSPPTPAALPSAADFSGMSDNLGAGIDGGGGTFRGGCGELSASVPLGPFSSTTLRCISTTAATLEVVGVVGEGDVPLLLVGLRYSRLRVRVKVRYVGVLPPDGTSSPSDKTPGATLSSVDERL